VQTFKRAPVLAERKRVCSDLRIRKEAPGPVNYRLWRMLDAGCLPRATKAARIVMASVSQPLGQGSCA
jgi:hypothetical protein